MNSQFSPQSTDSIVATPDNCPGQSCMLWVSLHGQILACCEHLQAMFGYRDEELQGRPISLLLPRLADIALSHDGRINPRLAFMCRCSTPFLAVDRRGAERCCALFVNHVTLATGPALAVSLCHLPQANRE